MSEEAIKSFNYGELTMVYWHQEIDKMMFDSLLDQDREVVFSLGVSCWVEYFLSYLLYWNC